MKKVFRNWHFLFFSFLFGLLGLGAFKQIFAEISNNIDSSVLANFLHIVFYFLVSAAFLTTSVCFAIVFGKKIKGS